jgi:hypothetical protein
MSLYLYAILNDTDLANLSGLEVQGMTQQPVQVHPIPPFALVYSEAQQTRYLASRANLLTHETVIEAVMNAVDVHVCVPLPLQFGLVVDDWAQVSTDLIAGNQKALQALLSKLAGKREVGIKLFWDQTAELNLILAENSALNQKREALMGKTLSLDEAISIGRELESALEDRRQDIIDAFLGELKPLSYEDVEGEILTENMLYNAAFLIDWEREPEFAALVESLDLKFDQRFRIRYNNFTAPFNFVKLDSAT